MGRPARRGLIDRVSIRPVAWIDVSVPVRTGMIVYDGDPEVRIEAATAIAGGDLANVSRMELGSHTGTHVDAPRHFIDGAAGADKLPPDALLGPAIVADARGLPGDIDAAALASLGLPDGTERVLFRTHDGELWDRRMFTRDFAGVAADAAQELVAMGVSLVGIDYLSIAPSADPAPTHRALLEAGVVIVEGLDLRAAAPGRYELVCLPLRLEGGDGAPARALVRPLG
jgi:arylformamidase